MKKLDYLKGSGQTLKSWLGEVKQKISSPEAAVSKKLQDYFGRHLTDEVVSTSMSLLKKRTTMILYLTESSDSTENNAYNEEEIRMAMQLLTPEDFNPDTDCIYCLSSFSSLVELQKHFEVCTV